MAIFKTKIHCIYSKHKPVYCESGSRLVDTYDSKFDEDGELIVFKSGKRDLFEYIQSFKESCDINNIVARFMRGEIPDLNFVQGAYIDTTQYPSTYAEMVNIVKNGQEVFDSLPAELKALFDNNAVKFYSSSGDEVAAKLGEFYKKDEVIVDEHAADE